MRTHLLRELGRDSSEGPDQNDLRPATGGRNLSLTAPCPSRSSGCVLSIGAAGPQVAATARSTGRPSREPTQNVMRILFSKGCMSGPPPLP